MFGFICIYIFVFFLYMYILYFFELNESMIMTQPIS